MELLGDWKLRRYGRCEIDNVSSKCLWKTVDSREDNILIFTIFKNGVMTVRDDAVVLEYHNLAKVRLKALRRRDVLLFVIGGQQGGPRKWRVQMRPGEDGQTDTAVTAAMACSRALAHFLPVTVIESEGDIPAVDGKKVNNEHPTNDTGVGLPPAGTGLPTAGSNSGILPTSASSDLPSAGASLESPPEDTNCDLAPVGTDPGSLPTGADAESLPADTDSRLLAESKGSLLPAADATSGMTTPGASSEPTPPAGGSGSETSAAGAASSSRGCLADEEALWDDHTSRLTIDGAVSLENVLEEVLKGDVLGIPEAYACGGLAGGRGLENVLRLCLADPTLPQLVGVVEQLMKGL